MTRRQAAPGCPGRQSEPERPGLQPHLTRHDNEEIAVTAHYKLQCSAKLLGRAECIIPAQCGPGLERRRKWMNITRINRATYIAHNTNTTNVIQSNLSKNHLCWFVCTMPCLQFAVGRGDQLNKAPDPLFRMSANMMKVRHQSLGRKTTMWFFEMC